MTMVMTMVTNQNRALGRDRLRARIYESAIAQFRAHGFDRATVDGITAAAGVAKGTFFNFYKTKVDVLAEYYWRVDERLAPLRKALDPGQPRAALVRYGQAVEREFRREGPMLPDLLSQILRHDALRQLDRASGEADAAQFKAFFAEARERGTVRATLRPGEAAELFLDVWSGTVSRWLETGARNPLSKMLERRLAYLFRGFAGEDEDEATRTTGGTGKHGGQLRRGSEAGTRALQRGK